MSLSSDTDNLLSMDVWGEQVEIVRNATGYGDTGLAGDLWAVVSQPNADIQRISGNNPIRDLGQGRFSSHRIFLPGGANVRQGDRIRPSGWIAGQAEYFVQAVLADEGHTEIRANIVRPVEGANLDYLLLEIGSYLLLEDGGGILLEN